MVEMTAIRLNQLKKASEAYKEQKAIYEDLTTEDMETALPPWPQFRDAFLADWNLNRIIVDEKEADEMFNKAAEEALAQIEAAEGTTTETTTMIPSLPGEALVNTSADPKKKRGRPPGKKTAKVAKKSYSKAKTKAVKTAKAKKATKKEGPSKMDLARATVEKFAAKGWSRKDILARLVEQNGLSPAYAATAYQKLA